MPFHNIILHDISYYICDMPYCITSVTWPVTANKLL